MNIAIDEFYLFFLSNLITKKKQDLRQIQNTLRIPKP
jgi:hypothetical protein